LLNLQTEHAILAPEKPKHTLLPVLVVLFLVSYGLMAMLVVEQGRTIDTQRNLIHQLFQDSAALTAMRSHAIPQTSIEIEPRTQVETQAPSSQVDPTHPGSANPSDKAGSKRNSETLRKQAPPRPPQVTSDVADERRALNLI
jgi:hypothetical protein